MFRIRKIVNPYLSGNTQVMSRVKDILRQQFPGVISGHIEKLSEQMISPVESRYQTSVVVADDLRGNIRGFAIMMFMSDIRFCYLDFLAVTPGKPTSGVGGAIYERVREEAIALNTIGLFYECLPDDPALCKDLSALAQNKRRLAFYERYGAYPIINTRYETSVNEGDDCPPYLVYDDLGSGHVLTAGELKKVYTAILNRKYSGYCPDNYVKMVVGSIKDDPVKLRKPRYTRSVTEKNNLLYRNLKVKLFVNSRHHIHHVREIGYVESPVRIFSILREISKLGIMEEEKVRPFPEKYITEIHNRAFVTYLKKVCDGLENGKSVYPYVFPLRNVTKPPKILSVRAGYYCIDTFTPLNSNAYLAARWGVNCVLSAAESVLSGRRLAYALTRPPGHHAEQNAFGGFCYFNNAAIAANYLSKYGRVAILDIDYHHGNGQQQIFYERNDVLTISIHGHPSFAYPYFSGFGDEKGTDAGYGYNHNFPLREIINGEEYRQVLARAMGLIRKFNPEFLIIALGLDTAKGDPTGTWLLSAHDFHQNGSMIADLRLPTLFVQEGGYRNRFPGINARNFFAGFYERYTGMGNIPAHKSDENRSYQTRAGELVRGRTKPESGPVLDG